MTHSTTPFQQALQRIDQANAADPRTELWEGKEYAKELLYSRRMTQGLDRLEPDASEALRLAAAAQHICRWEIPRDSFPRNRVGYRKWRETLYQFHADRTESILRDVGYDDQTIGRVRHLLEKKNLKTDLEMQTLEDVICLVFLQFYFDDFARDHEEEKLITILQRTWKKMSPRGHSAAASLELSTTAHTLIAKALDTGETG